MFHIDSETGLVLKVASYKTPDDRLAKIPLWIWTADAFETIEGHPVVTRCTSLSPASDRDVERWTQFTTESINFNKSYPAAQFTPKIMAGVNIIDSDGNLIIDDKGNPGGDPRRP